MVIPINPDVNKTKHLAEEHRQDWPERVQAVAMRHLHLQHHDRDDYSKHSIAECLKSVLGHTGTISKRLNFLIFDFWS